MILSWVGPTDVVLGRLAREAVNANRAKIQRLSLRRVVLKIRADGGPRDASRRALANRGRAGRSLGCGTTFATTTKFFSDYRRNEYPAIDKYPKEITVEIRNSNGLVEKSSTENETKQRRNKNLCAAQLPKTRAGASTRGPHVPLVFFRPSSHRWHRRRFMCQK